MREDWLRSGVTKIIFSAGGNRKKPSLQKDVLGSRCSKKGRGNKKASPYEGWLE